MMVKFILVNNKTTLDIDLHDMCFQKDGAMSQTAHETMEILHARRYGYLEFWRRQLATKIVYNLTPFANKPYKIGALNVNRTNANKHSESNLSSYRKLDL